MSDNTEQEKLWNGSLGEGFIRVESYIDRIVEPISKAAVDTVCAQSEDRILDVGCGCGSTSMALAKTGATVTGVDISEKMIAQAKAKSKAVTNLSFCTADAAVENFERNYTHVFSRFGVMFFSDPTVAFSNMHSGLVSKGKLTFSCWQGLTENEWIGLSVEAIKPFQSEDAPPPDPRSPGGFAFADKEYVLEILQGAGFSNIKIKPLKATLDMGQSMEEIMSFHCSVGPLAGLLETLDEDSGKEAIEAVKKSIEKRMGDRGLRLAAAAWLVTADAQV